MQLFWTASCLAIASAVFVAPTISDLHFNPKKSIQSRWSNSKDPQMPFKYGYLSGAPTVDPTASATSPKDHNVDGAIRRKYTLQEQSSDLCDAGSRQWTGIVDINEEKSIFYWYFESRNNPENDPVILWLSGGPGATGELGIFKNSGPCAVNDDGNSTSRKEYAWTDSANVLYIDQPAGIGFSKITDRDFMAVDLNAGSRDLYKFLQVFTNEVFPDLATRPWHIAGESMGGHYTTGYISYIVSQQRDRGLAADLLIDIRSIIVVDGYIDHTRQAAGYYDFFCSDWNNSGSNRDWQPLMNETVCKEMAATVPECEILGKICRETYNIEQCTFAALHCEITVGKYYLSEVVPGGWNPYDSRKKCTEPPLCSDLSRGPALNFLNQPWVQERLGFKGIDFELIDFDANQRWAAAKHIFKPTVRELQYLLDETDIRVMFLNGNNDIIINTPGQMRMLDEQPWSQQAWYRNQRFEDWFFHNGSLAHQGTKGGQCKGNHRLSLYSVDEAGHTSSWDQPEAIGALIKHWVHYQY